MTGRLRQLSEPRLRQQARIEKSQTAVERDSLVQRVRKIFLAVHEISRKVYSCPSSRISMFSEDSVAFPFQFFGLFLTFKVLFKFP